MAQNIQLELLYRNGNVTIHIIWPVIIYLTVLYGSYQSTYLRITVKYQTVSVKCVVCVSYLSSLDHIDFTDSTQILKIAAAILER